MQAVDLVRQRRNVIGSRSPIGKTGADTPQPMNKTMTHGISGGSFHVRQEDNHLPAPQHTWQFEWRTLINSNYMYHNQLQWQIQQADHTTTLPIVWDLAAAREQNLNMYSKLEACWWSDMQNCSVLGVQFWGLWSKTVFSGLHPLSPGGGTLYHSQDFKALYKYCVIIIIICSWISLTDWLSKPLICPLPFEILGSTANQLYFYEGPLKSS